MRQGRTIQRGAGWLKIVLATAIGAICLLPASAAASAPVFYELPPGTHAFSMTPGPEGKVWFSGSQSPSDGSRRGLIGSVDVAGRMEFFSLPPDVSARGIAAGPEGNLWVAAVFYNKAGYLVPRIGRLTPGGAYAEFVPARHVGGVGSVAAGPDGAVWFTLAYWVDGRPRPAIGRIDSNGSITKFPLPPRSGPGEIVTGPDGNLWFTEQGGGRPKIGRITPAGRITHFPVPNSHARFTSIAAGPDGYLWFGQFSTRFGSRVRSLIGRISTSGRFSRFRLPGRSGSAEVTADPAGKLWFTSPLREGPTGIGSISTGGVVTPQACLKPTPCEVDADALTVDAAGRLWFSMSKYYSHGGGGGTGLMEGIMEEREAGFVGYFPSG